MLIKYLKVNIIFYPPMSTILDIDIFIFIFIEISGTYKLIILLLI